MSKLDPAVVGAIARDEVLSFLSSPKVREAGRVQGVGDGIATVIGLTSVMSGELVRFDNGIMGIAMNLDEESVSIVLLGPDAGIHEGDFVERTGDVAGMPVGDSMLGRVVNALGEPIDQKGAIFTNEHRPVERVAYGVLARKSVDVPLLTGIKAIDAMVPVGRGQRQLIIGDRQTGKTAIAIDTILRQKDTGVLCVYVAIGQKNSTVAGIISTLSEQDALSYTAVVVAGASEPAPLQYMAPYSGCALAEYWMEHGRDVLIIYDDLSKHAVAYRAMSLLMRRPPGREAYPGDVFYLHSRLLERAGRVTEKYGGGSITAFPIIETQGGDMSAYIPTNVISITDGQIYLEAESFNAGIRPAVNPGLSVSRVGGAAQTKTMKKIAAPIRTELAQYRELASFAQFSSDMDEDTRRRLDHGERIVEILKQGQYKPYALAQELLILLAVTRGYFADVHIENIGEYEQDMLGYFQTNLASLLSEFGSSDGLDSALEQAVIDGIEAFKRDYAEKHRPAKGR